MDTALTVIVIASVVALASLGALIFISASRRNRVFDTPRVYRRRTDVIEEPVERVIDERPRRVARSERPRRVETVRRTEDYEAPVETVDEIRRL